MIVHPGYSDNVRILNLYELHADKKLWKWMHKKKYVHHAV